MGNRWMGMDISLNEAGFLLVCLFLYNVAYPKVWLVAKNFVFMAQMLQVYQASSSDSVVFSQYTSFGCRVEQAVFLNLSLCPTWEILARTHSLPFPELNNFT